MHTHASRCPHRQYHSVRLQRRLNRRPDQIHAIAHRLSPCSSRHLSLPRPTPSGWRTTTTAARTTTIWCTSGSSCGISTGTARASTGASPRRSSRCARGSTRWCSTRASCCRFSRVESVSRTRQGAGRCASRRTATRSSSHLRDAARLRRHGPVHRSPTTAGSRTAGAHLHRGRSGRRTARGRSGARARTTTTTTGFRPTTFPTTR